MKLASVDSANEETNGEMEAVNDLSEKLIKADYLSAELYGPHWALGQDSEVI